MSFFIDWAPQARSQLASFWLMYTSHRQAITAAQARIDRLLAADPINNGQVRSEGLYAIDVWPLRALYEIDNATRKVIVVSLTLLA